MTESPSQIVYVLTNPAMLGLVKSKRSINRVPCVADSDVIGVGG